MPDIKYRPGERTTDLVDLNGVPVIRYRIFEGFPVIHGISTRLGGVSEGFCGSMNMNVKCCDTIEHVAENRKRFAGALGYEDEKLVMSDQVHQTTIFEVKKEDAGKGVVRQGVDGLMTDVPGLPLMTFYADCVPLLFYDPVNQVIAMAHSGWRGTVARIGRICLERMKEVYGTEPKDVRAAIGPSICQECYEVDDPLLTAFHEAFGDEADAWFKPSDKPDHYLLDLAGVCRYTLVSAGVPMDQVAMPDLCTCCNPELLFSHRASNGKRGTLSVVMEIPERKC